MGPPRGRECRGDAGRARDGLVHAIDVDSRGNIWLFERCGANTCLDSDVDPILQFDPQGRLLQSFGAGMFVFPHSVIVDDADNVWIVDAGVAEGKGNQIFKFSPRGEVLLTISEPGAAFEREAQALTRAWCMHIYMHGYQDHFHRPRGLRAPPAGAP